VLIDTFNDGHFMGEAICSVFVQDFPADQMEIIMVDDGSTDGTRERVAEYAERVQFRIESYEWRLRDLRAVAAEFLGSPISTRRL
jgi:glycosyltransferase involved in cell wall biosynthesis